MGEYELIFVKIFTYVFFIIIISTLITKFISGLSMPSKLSIRLISPFRCRFNLDYTVVASGGKILDKFFKVIGKDLENKNSSLCKNIPNGIVVRVRDVENNLGPRYVSAQKSGSLYSSPGYFDVFFDDSLKEEISNICKKSAKEANEKSKFDFSEIVKPNIESLFFSVYGNTIAILTMEIDLDIDPDMASGDKWHGLDTWTTYFKMQVLDKIYLSKIKPTVQAVSDCAREHLPGFIIPPSEYAIYYDMLENEEISKIRKSAMGQLLWVNRTLICPRGTDTTGWLVKRLDDKDALDMEMSDAYLFSGNSVIMTHKGREVSNLESLWEGIYTAQYYYAVLDVISKNITRFVGQGFGKKDNNALRQLSRDMEHIINSVTIIQVKYKDIYTELQGFSRRVFKRLETEWDFASLFANVQNKINLCKSNVDRLNQYISQRNQLRVQLVLTIVAGMGILNMMISLSNYAHKLLEEQKLGAENEVFGILNIAASLTPNTLLWIGFVIACFVVSTIIINRPR